MRHLLPAIFLLFLLTASIPARTQDISYLAAHRAEYTLSLVSRHQGSDIVNMKGTLAYDWRPVCGGFASDHHFKLTYAYAGASPAMVVSNYTTYETADGHNLQFASRRTEDEKLQETLRGNADVTLAKLGLATYASPKNLRIPLPAGTLLPTFHTMALLRAIKRGDKIFDATVFDGSDDAGPVEINTVIGPSVIDKQPGGQVEQSLINTPAWRVTMAFFPLNSDAPDADYTMTATLHDNGIITDTQINYKDFSVRQNLLSLKAQNAPACPQ